jgi:tetrahydromethanopterin S-methyltransferase subunit G
MEPGQAKNLLGIGGIISGSDMLAEIKQRRLGTPTAATLTGNQLAQKIGADNTGTVPPVGFEDNFDRAQGSSSLSDASMLTGVKQTDIDALNKKLAEIEARNARYEADSQTMRSNLDRAQGTIQALSQRQSVQQVRQPEPLPQVQIDDPELAAAFNTVEQRIGRKIDDSLGQRDQAYAHLLRQQQNALFQQNVDRIKSSKPQFAKYFSDEQLTNFAQPYLNNPQFMSVDWGRELELAYKVANYPSMEAELQAAQKKLEQYEKKQDNIKSEKNKNLSMVPGTAGSGGLSSGSSSNTSAAERVLSMFSRKGQARVPFKQKSQALKREWGIR